MRARLNLSAAAAAGISLFFADVVSAQSLTPRPVEQSALARDAFSTGVLSRSNGALPNDLWRGADPAAVDRLLDAAPARPAAPSLGEALRRTLLSNGDGPGGASASLGAKKLGVLIGAGYVDEARTIASLSNAPRDDVATNQALAVADLLDGKLNDACLRNASLATGRDSTPSVMLRVLCYAAKGERDAAELTLGLLREQGALSDTDDALMTAVVSGVAPKSMPAPENAFHLAALRQLKLPLSPGNLKRANGGVLKAVMYDATVDVSTRAAAGVLAAKIGAVQGPELAALYAALPATTAEIADADKRAASRPNDPYSDVLVYKKIAGMTAPEMLRDKAGAVAAAIGAADTFARLRGAALVYSADIKTFEGTILSPQEYGRFALARLVAGDAASAARWLDVMQPETGATPLDETDAGEFIDLVSLLNILDPAAAKRISTSANVAIDDPLERAPVGLGPIAPSMPATLEAAFDAALGGSKGQAALAALAASADSPATDAIARVVIAQSMRAAGLDDLRRGFDLEQAIGMRFESKTPLSPSLAAAPGAVLQRASAPAVNRNAQGPAASPVHAAGKAPPMAKPASTQAAKAPSQAAKTAPAAKQPAPRVKPSPAR